MSVVSHAHVMTTKVCNQVIRDSVLRESRVSSAAVAHVGCTHTIQEHVVLLPCRTGYSGRTTGRTRALTRDCLVVSFAHSHELLVRLPSRRSPLARTVTCQRAQLGFAVKSPAQIEAVFQMRASAPCSSIVARGLGGPVPRLAPSRRVATTTRTGVCSSAQLVADSSDQRIASQIWRSKLS